MSKKPKPAKKTTSKLGYVIMDSRERSRIGWGNGLNMFSWPHDNSSSIDIVGPWWMFECTSFPVVVVDHATSRRIA